MSCKNAVLLNCTAVDFQVLSWVLHRFFFFLDKQVRDRHGVRLMMERACLTKPGISTLP